MYAALLRILACLLYTSNITLNTIMAEELEQFADELEASRDFQADLEKLIRRVFTEHQRIIFNGNGYDEAWLKEARKRGLSNLTSTADALPMYTCLLYTSRCV